MSDDTALILPDPQESSLPALMRACDQLAYVLRTDPPTDLDDAISLLSKMAAIETYLSKA